MSSTEEGSANMVAVARRALPLWGLENATIAPLKIRENAVYRIDRDSRPVGALRVHRPGYHSNAALRSEFVWMRALGEAGIAVPQAIPSVRGVDFEVIGADGGGVEYQVDLLKWIEGRQLGAISEGVSESSVTIDAQFETVGRTMARIHRQSESWSPPPEFNRHAWDVAGLVGENPFWGRFWELAELDPAQRILLRSARNIIGESLLQCEMRHDQYGLIHADLIPENILVADAGQRVIDFDDAGYGWFMFDVATSLYFLTEQTYYETAKQALVRGYREVRRLPDAALDLLPLFLAARGTTYLGWLHTRSGSRAARELAPLLIRLACNAVERLVPRA